MSSESKSPREVIEEFYGGEPRVSDWVLVEQATIDKFAEHITSSLGNLSVPVVAAE